MKKKAGGKKKIMRIIIRRIGRRSVLSFGTPKYPKSNPKKKHGPLWIRQAQVSLRI